MGAAVEQDTGKPAMCEYYNREPTRVDARNLRKETRSGKQSIRREQGDNVGSNGGFILTVYCLIDQGGNFQGRFTIYLRA